MIRSFRHSGVERFFRTGAKSGIQPRHAAKLARQLLALNAAHCARHMDIPEWRLHPLRSTLTGHWSVWVDGNWRLTFAFDREDAVLVDYQDYH